MVANKKCNPSHAIMKKRETELLFPSYVVPALLNTCGEIWQLLVKEIALLENDSLEIMAFTLIMARIGNCVLCNSGSYRAMQGCRQCARQALSRFKGSDEDLEEMYKAAKIEVIDYMEKMSKNE